MLLFGGLGLWHENSFGQASTSDGTATDTSLRPRPRIQLNANQSKEFHSHLEMCLAVSPDGKMLATCGSSDWVTVRDVDTLETIQESAAAGLHLNSVAFSRNGRFVFAGSLNTTPQVGWWKIGTDEKGVFEGGVGRFGRELFNGSLCAFGPHEIAMIKPVGRVVRRVMSVDRPDAIMPAICLDDGAVVVIVRRGGFEGNDLRLLKMDQARGSSFERSVGSFDPTTCRLIQCGLNAVLCRIDDKTKAAVVECWGGVDFRRTSECVIPKCCGPIVGTWIPEAGMCCVGGKEEHDLDAEPTGYLAFVDCVRGVVIRRLPISMPVRDVVTARGGSLLITLEGFLEQEKYRIRTWKLTYE